jgi:hypothetical protein
MKRLTVGLAIALILAGTFLIGGMAQAKDGVSRYAVTITNITRGQIISPPVVISHNQKFQVFHLGNPASPELAALAEDADTVPLAALLDGLDTVYDYHVADGPILPGMSVTVEVKGQGGFRIISAAGMLVTTNDAFFAVRGVYARPGAGVQVNARAYDAGSEKNSELCAFIPGPPCGNGGVRDTEGAEGYVYIHSGIHGHGDLEPADLDWQNPVAIVNIQRVK